MTRVAGNRMFAVAAVLICACTSPAPLRVADREGQPIGPEKAGGRVIIGVSADIAGLNPVLQTDPQSLTVSQRIYESLVDDDPQTGQPKPRLAASWATALNGRSLTFTLRDHLVWSDGSPLTVDDVVFTLMATLRSRSAPARQTLADDVLGARDYAEGRTASIAGLSTSGQTLTATLTQPLCTAVGDIGEIGILPRAVFGKYLDQLDANRTIDDAPENIAPPLASGPFRFQEWAPRDHVTLVRNDRFFLGPPRLDEWTYRVVPNQAAIVAELKTGEIDVGLVNAAAVADLTATGAVQVMSTPGTGYTYIAWNELRTGKEFFRDKAVRQALTYGLDWDQMIATLLSGAGQRVVAHTPPSSWAYDSTGLNPYRYDVQKARQLLENDGWQTSPDGIYQKYGQRLAFVLTTSDSLLRNAILQIAVEEYKQIGVDVTPRTESFEAFLQRTIASHDPTYGGQGGRDVDAYLLGWGQVGPDPDAYWYWHSSQLQAGGNRVGYQNPFVDRALEAGRTQCAPDDRKAAYHQMDLQLNEDQPVSFGFVSASFLGVNTHLQRIEPGPYSYLAQWNVEQWWRSP